MDEKKIRFELSRVALIFVILFGLCVLIWTFILGVWIGTKIAGKPAVEETKVAKRPELSPIGQPVANLTNVTEAKDVVASNLTAQSAMDLGNATRIPVVATNQTNQTDQQGARSTISETKKETARPVREEPRYQRKEVAQLATKIKEEPSGRFTIQVGAYSQRDKAELMRQKIREAGYSAEIQEITHEGRTLYRVYLGRFSSREEAEKVIPIVKSKLNVDRPFVTELR